MRGSASSHRPARASAQPQSVVAVDRRPVGAGTSRKLDRLGRADQVVGAVGGRLEIGLDAVGLEEPIDDCDGGSLTARLGRLAGAREQVSEQGDRLRRRRRSDRAARLADRGAQVAVRRLDASELDASARIAGK